MIDEWARIGPGTALGRDVTVGAFCILGADGPAERGLRIGPGGVIRSHVVIYRGTTIGSRVHIGHGALVREDCDFADDVSVGSHTIIEHHVVIGDGARLHSACFVPEHSVIAAGAWLGPNVTVTNARYPNRPDTKSNLEGVLVDTGATIGAGAVLLPGVRVGARALVGAGAVVVDDVPPGVTVAGVPARRIS